MRRDTFQRARQVALTASSVVLLSGCASGFGLAGDTAGPPAPGARTETGDHTGPPPGPSTGVPTTAAGAEAPPPAADAASVPGADRFGVTAGDDFCSAAPKVAGGFVGIFDAFYAAQGPELQAQIEDALVAVDVLRSVAPEATRADLDESRRFLSQLQETLAASGWDLAAAASAHPDFFGGNVPDAGFAAMTGVTAAIAQQCGLTP